MASYGCVVTAGAGRRDNLVRTVLLAEQVPQLDELVVVLDGRDAWPYERQLGDRARVVFSEKHHPGREQPRNLGVRALDRSVTHVWFLDSDLVFYPDTILGHFDDARQFNEDGVLIGPYEWMAPGETHVGGRLEQSDPRWESFKSHDPAEPVVDDLGAALACFGGNLVWNRERFESIGGFHPELNHGRCEDGELGLRACENHVPMSYVRDALAFHVWHPRNVDWILEANRRDVPLLNQWHPWVETEGLTVRDMDGKRFNFVCPVCGDEINSIEYWSHYATH